MGRCSVPGRHGGGASSRSPLDPGEDPDPLAGGEAAAAPRWDEGRSGSDDGGDSTTDRTLAAVVAALVLVVVVDRLRSARRSMDA